MAPLRGLSVISAYARDGYTPSFDAYLKFIEDVFMNGARLNPKTDGRPDPRPTVRENAKILGDLSTEFDFTQAPRPPVVLPLHPPPGSGLPMTTFSPGRGTRAGEATST